MLMMYTCNCIKKRKSDLENYHVPKMNVIVPIYHTQYVLTHLAHDSWLQKQYCDPEAQHCINYLLVQLILHYSCY